jgi:hypothetical protein
MNMKKATLFILTIGLLVPMMFSISKASAQNTSDDSLKIQVITLRDKVSGVEERLATAESDLAKLTKIKLSGYIQAQWQQFENPSIYSSSYFSIRRARFKIQYEPVSGVCFVLQPDFSPGNFALKDAYVQANDPWLKTFSLWAGQFNRPNYEVEYSSSSREVAERSLVIRSLYPGERAIGAKLEITPPKIPLKVQLAIFNGNDGHSFPDAANANINPINKDYDNTKDFMGRATYGFKFGNFGGLTIGGNYYYGIMKASSTATLDGEYKVTDGAVKIGSSLNRNWFGVEMQLYMDFLGGMTIKGEFLAGKNDYTGFYGTTSVTDITGYVVVNDTTRINTLTTKTTYNRPNMLKSFMGYYVYLVKNIGKRNQVAVRYDYYDPNTDLKGSQIGEIGSDGKTPVYGYSASSTTYGAPKTTNSGTIYTTDVTKSVVTSSLNSGTADIAYGTVTLAYSYFFTENIKIMVDYDIVMNEKVGINAKGDGNVTTKYTVNNIPGVLDYSKVFPQNMLTIRLQAKF